MASFEDFVNALVKPANGEFIVLKDLTNAFTEWRQGIQFGPPMQINDLFYAEERSKDIFPAESYEPLHKVTRDDGTIVSYHDCVKGWKLLSPPSNPVEGEEVSTPTTQETTTDIPHIYSNASSDTHILTDIKNDQQAMKISILGVSDVAAALRDDLNTVKQGLSSIETSLAKMQTQLDAMSTYSTTQPTVSPYGDAAKAATQSGWMHRVASYFN